MKKILLADDEPVVRELLAITLGEENFVILQARGGREAVELARAERPDLVLLDLRMPEMDGLEACRILKADPTTAAIKVIVLTARSSLFDEEASMGAGADDFFSKPFSPIALLSKVYEVLD